MIVRCKTAFLFLIVPLLFLTGADIPCQTHRTLPKAYSLVEFGKGYADCRAKGRLQDKEYCSSPVIDQIIADGKDSIPILISQLTDEHRTPQPAFDFWNYTMIGDVALAILEDLFLDSDWKTHTLPGHISIWEICKNQSSGPCLHRYADIHGRHFIQQQWQMAWMTHKNEIFWDAKARCFRVKQKQ